MKDTLNSTKNSFEREFDVFLDGDIAQPGSLSSRDIMPEGDFREKLLKKLKTKIGRDLVKSPVQLGLIYGMLSLVGYAVSLMMCAQWSVGLSNFAFQASFHLHGLPGPICPLVCGAVFTGVPFLLSCVLLNRFQQRYLITRLWWFLALVPIVATGLMLILPKNLQHTHISSLPISIWGSSAEAAWIGLWATAALLTPYFLEAIVYFWVKPKRYSPTVVGS